MEPKAFIRSVKERQASEIPHLLQRMSPAERQACQPAALALFLQVERFYTGPGKDPQMLDADAAITALLALSSFEDLKSLQRLPAPVYSPIEEVYASADLPWLQEAVSHFLKPQDVLTLQPLWCKGLCEIPKQEAFIHAHFDTLQSHRLSEDILLSGPVWRFFEVEGTRNHSLNRHDKLAAERRAKGLFDRSAPWADRLLGYAACRKLARADLLSAALNGVARMNRSADIAWLTAFHARLEPSREELSRHQSTLTALRSAPDAAKRSFAGRCLKRLRA